ncbi:MAG: glycoside hydrolase N-terminal domain-containing protein [Puniceicoccales bacterium]|jgi:alpha-L-fucosidase 2|nr:glycoside hydrolase N-terminal domain-containing protein [Puniceicoccales bacterium]
MFLHTSPSLFKKLTFGAAALLAGALGFTNTSTLGSLGIPATFAAAKDDVQSRSDKRLEEQIAAFHNNTLLYDAPAHIWTEALPVGNGRLGAMVFGGTDTERIQLNEATVWGGSPYSNNSPDALAALPKIRELMFAGKHRAAHTLAANTVATERGRTRLFAQGMPYQTVGDLFIEFPKGRKIKNYWRRLDLQQAIVKSAYATENDGLLGSVTIAAFKNDVIFHTIQADRNETINFTAFLKTPHKKQNITIENGDTLVLRATAGDHEGVEGKVKFTVLVKIKHQGGTLTTKDGKITLSGARRATFTISIATNYKNYRDISDDDYAKAKTLLENALKKNEHLLIQEHLNNYKKQFSRASLNLGPSTDKISKTTAERVENFHKTNDPALVALFFNFGRYLLISSSQPGGQPATLQGIWNEHLAPPWDSKHTININTEMNYWPAEVANMPKSAEPLIAMLKDLSVAGAETAKTMYGVRGWVAHHNTDLWRITGPVDSGSYAIWPSGGAWLTRHLWEHYLFSGDKDFLREIYPVMKGAAQFYSDFLCEEPASKKLVIAPSTSPENQANGVAITYGVTMDNQIVFETFSNVSAAAEVLGIDKEFADKLRAQRARLSPMKIGKHGQLQEWFFDWDNPKDHHRHVSHLYGLFPSWQISPIRTPELFAAARNSLNYRGDASTGWSMAWKVCLWARFLDGNRAAKLISEQLRPPLNGGGGTYPNLFDACPPFIIDGNFGCTAGIAEMLVQSHDGAVHLLPALPDAWKAQGRVRGLRTRGGFVINELAWKNGEITALEIESTLGGNLRLRLPKSAINGKTLPHHKGLCVPVRANKRNPNPLFALPPIPAAEIADAAKPKLTLPTLPETEEFDAVIPKGSAFNFELVAKDDLGTNAVNLSPSMP